MEKKETFCHIALQLFTNLIIKRFMMTRKINNEETATKNDKDKMIVYLRNL